MFDAGGGSQLKAHSRSTCTPLAEAEGARLQARQEARQEPRHGSAPVCRELGRPAQVNTSSVNDTEGDDLRPLVVAKVKHCRRVPRPAGFRSSMVLRRIAALALAAVCSLTLIGGASLTVPAQASPRIATPDAEGQPPRFRVEWRSVPKAKKKQIQVAVDIIRRAVSKDGKTLDYKKANKYDKGEVGVRRQLAATYLWSGRKVSHISKAELKKVKKHISKKKKPKGFSHERVQSFGTSCPGNSGVTTVYDKHGARRGWAVYLNQCQTTAITATMQGIGATTAILAISLGKKRPDAAAACGIVSIFSLIGAYAVDEVRNYSSTQSVYFLSLSSPIGMVTTLHAQN